MTRLILFVGTALLLTAGTVWAGPFEDAAAAYARGEYVTAFKIIQPLAAQGDVRAQFSLGPMYLNGHGVSQDSPKADKWFRLSVAQGNAKAQAHLGALYGSGQGVPHDYATARQWYEHAAVQGYASAQNNLGVLYRDGHGLPQEDVKA
jgi:TPR repeat protein